MTFITGGTSLPGLPHMVGGSYQFGLPGAGFGGAPGGVHLNSFPGVSENGAGQGVPGPGAIGVNQQASGLGLSLTPAEGGTSGQGSTGVNDALHNILNDPTFSSILSGFGATNGISVDPTTGLLKFSGAGEDAGTRKAATDQALIQYGGIPDFSQSQYGLNPTQQGYLNSDLLNDPGSPTFASLAENNPESTLAQLHQALNANTLSMRNQLAANGMLQSGELTYQSGQLGQQYADAQSQALDALLSALGGFQSTYASGQQTALEQLMQALATASTAQLNRPENNIATHTTSPTAPPNTGQQNHPLALSGTDMYGGYLPAVAPGTPKPTGPYDPYTTTLSANPSGGSANKRQGVFSIH